MIDFLPEREDLITSFDTQGCRVFVANHNAIVNQAPVYSLWIVNLESGERVHSTEVEAEFEEDIYKEVSDFLANQ